MSVQTRVQVRRGTLAQWIAASGVAGQGILYQGELGYETDTSRFKIGDGTTAWSSLNYASVVPSGFIAGSGVSLTPGTNGSTLTISLSDPTIQLTDITDLSSNARTFLSTPSSANLSTLVSDETGSGALVFANSPVMSGVSVSGNLTVSGSGLVASNINDFNTAVRTNRLDQMAVPTSGVSLNSQKITNLADPTNDQDAATKIYVDAARSGLDVKQSVRVATTESIALSGVQTIDDVSVIAQNRVLVKNQAGANAYQNGIYVAATGTWSRATDADTDAEVTAGMFTFVTEGTLGADSGWVLTTNDTIVLGTTLLAFTQFSGAGQVVAGSGMTKSGSTLDIGTASNTRIVVNADSIDLATITQSDSSGSAGSTFVQTVTRDGYGRVSGVITAAVQDATVSAKGIASFDSGDFSVTGGAVIIKASGVDNSQLANSSITIGSTSISLGASGTTIAGLSSVTSTSFVGALTGNASTATTLATARTINGTSFNGSADITIASIDGGTP